MAAETKKNKMLSRKNASHEEALNCISDKEVQRQKGHKKQPFYFLCDFEFELWSHLFREYEATKDFQL